MNGIALVKQVPDRNSAFRPEGAWIDESSLGYGVNEYDRYAVEAILQMKEAGHLQETVAVTAGPEDAGQILRTCLAMGMDRAVHVVCDRARFADPFPVAKNLARAVAQCDPGVLTAGLLAEDSANAQVGGLVAGLLGFSWASAVTRIEWRNDEQDDGQDDGRLVVERELGANRIAVVELRLPAALGVQTGLNTPRYASLRGIMASRRKPLTRLEWEDAPDTGPDAGMERLRLERPERSRAAMLEGAPEEIAARAVERIRSETGVL